MTATTALLCGLALFVASSADIQGNQWNMQQKQEKLMQLLVNVQQHNKNQEQAQIGNTFNMNNQLNNFNNQYAVMQFQNTWDQGKCLHRGKMFNYHNPHHLHQAIQLFDVFYFAKDFNTFYQAACWARDHVNEWQFVYAMSVAILKREDTMGIALPPQSETHPNMYMNAKAIQEAQNHKQQGQQSANVHSNTTNNWQDCWSNNDKQQQKFPFSHQNQNWNPNQNQNQNQDQNQNQYMWHERRMAYYNEDVHMNQQWANQMLNNPCWFSNNQKYNQKDSWDMQTGEKFCYYMQQMLARQNLERYSNDMPRVQPFQFNHPIQPGYNPQLQCANGQAMPARANNYALQNNANPHDLHLLHNLDRRIVDAIDSHQVQGGKGTMTTLNAENGIEVLGQIINGNCHNANKQYYTANNGMYSYIDMFRKVVGSIVDPNNHQGNAPGAIQNDHAAHRDPVFHQVIARIVNHIQNFKNQLQPYKQEQLILPGIKVQSLEVDKMNTFCDKTEVDLYNAIHYKDGEKAQDCHYKAWQQRLNNKPFNYMIKVDSDKDTKVIVRCFMGPMHNSQGQQMTLQQARHNFVEIDRFMTNLKNGQNQIQRNSKQSTRFVQTPTSTRNLFNMANQASYNGTEDQNMQLNTFPQHMMLPMGTRGGQQYVMAVAINDYTQNPNQHYRNENQMQPQDNRPHGFPFDRPIKEAAFHEAKNIRFQQVTIWKTKNENQ